MQSCFQNKCYPRDSAKDALCRGRVRVQLKNSDESFVNEKFQSSKNMMLKNPTTYLGHSGLDIIKFVHSLFFITWKVRFLGTFSFVFTLNTNNGNRLKIIFGSDFSNVTTLLFSKTSILIIFCHLPGDGRLKHKKNAYINLHYCQLHMRPVTCDHRHFISRCAYLK